MVITGNGANNIIEMAAQNMDKRRTIKQRTAERYGYYKTVKKIAKTFKKPLDKGKKA